MTNKILSIVGPTAVGKTAFAWRVAEYFWDVHQIKCDIISADSRQVYKGLEILSGADIPPDAEWCDEYWQVGQHRLWGVSFLKPTDEWSVAHFRRFVKHICEQSWQAGRLPILVGGTGLYAEWALSDDPQMDSKPDMEIRAKAEVLDLEELQRWVQSEAAVRWSVMNDSDRANPRRLVRVLEQTTTPAATKQVNATSSLVKKRENIDQLVIGITDDMTEIEKRIVIRVEQRWNHGAMAEVDQLLEIVLDQGRLIPAISATGVKQIASYIQGDCDEQAAKTAWVVAERQYAKRQFTWWKKRENVEWTAITEMHWQKLALDKITAWYGSKERVY